MFATDMVARWMAALFLLSCPYLLSAQSTTVVEDFLQSNRKNLGLSQEDVSDFVVHSEVKTRHNDLEHFYLKQAYNGIEIFNRMINLNILADGSVLSYGGSFVSDVASKVNADKPTLSPEEAVLQVAGHLKMDLEQSHQAQSIADHQYVIQGSTLSLRDIPVELVYHHSEEDRLLLAWDLSVDLPKSGDHLSYRVDALSGDILQEHNWTIHCKFHDHSEDFAFEECGEVVPMPETPMPIPPPPASFDYNVFALPAESPNHGSRSVTNAPWNNTNQASPYGWHDTNGASGQEYNITRGNNAHAYQDRNESDSSAGDEPNGGNNLDFNFAYDANAEPITNTDAAITNLFYVNNRIHDILYQYGFDEQAGNFQSNNYGRGGQGGDYVYAEGQDGAGLGNANFSTPPDGGNPRMQMFNWTASSNASDLFTVNSPASIAGSYSISQAVFGPGVNSTPVTGTVEQAFDSSSDPALVCNAVSNDVNGKIAMIDRGDCTFVTKTQNAQDAGAIACIICNNVAGSPVTMAGNSTTINIPVVMLSQGDCNLLKAQSNVSVTLVDNGNNGPSLWDASFDNGIIIHEYGHGISTRLTGGPASSSCLFNDEQMGEGISDWYGLMLTMRSGDSGPAPRGIGTWVANQPTTGQGIRPAPYSTDMVSYNGYTYGNLCDSEISLPHGVGFIWASMLYDLSWALIDKYGFDADLINGTAGNNMAMQLVTDGLKIQPCSPGFVDARDAILQADLVNNNGENECLIWEVFARRGLGYSAAQGDTDNRCDGTEAFDMPPTCDILSIKKTAETEASAGSIITYNFEIKNRRSVTVSNVQVSDQLPPNTTYINGSGNCSATHNNGTLTFSVGTLASGATTNCYCQVTTDPSYFSSFYFEDDIEAGSTNFTTNNTGTIDLDWSLNINNPYSGTTAWFADNIEGITDQFLTFDVPSVLLAGNPQLNFWHNYDTETSWDGGVVEISTDGGSNWADLGPQFIQNGYNETIEVNPASGISGREAFTGNSLGYIQSKVDLSSFVGQTAKIRFRFASDEYVGGNGWWVDDIVVVDAKEIVNQACVTSAQGDNECDDASTLMLAPTSIRVQVQMLLQGPYAGGGMMNANIENLIPLNHPFNTSPLNYFGSESLSSVPDGAVDWVLVELRSVANPNALIGRAAGILMNDGDVYGVDGLAGVPYNGIAAGNYYIVVRQKSHLAVMSKSAVSLPNNIAYDFTNSGSAFGSGPLVNLGGGHYGLAGGDLNQDAAMTFQDYNIFNNNSTAIFDYLPQDINLDGIVSVADYNIYKQNASQIGISQVQ